MNRFLWSLCAVFYLSVSVLMAQTPDFDEIAKSVVLIESFAQDGTPIASGSGTIVLQSGLIYTNRHVLEDADIFTVALLDDPNEPPIRAYFARVVSVFNSIDFAVLQIEADINGNVVLPTSLRLPSLDLSAVAPVRRGDKLFTIGYPGVGDGNYVLTSGIITTLQNGDVGSERMVVSIQTDAEISPGNSGGLAVNEQGVPVGIPTAVSAEGQTLGRLGVILPFSYVQAVVDLGEGNFATNNSAPPADTDVQTPPNVVYGYEWACPDGTYTTNGVAIVVNMRSGFTYTATALGVEDFDPVLIATNADNVEDYLCNDDSTSASNYQVVLPTVNVSGASTSAQVSFSHSQSGFMDVAFIVGGYAGMSGEFVLVLEGMAVTPADGLGDPISIRVTEGVAQYGTPSYVHMIGTERALDPFMVAVNGESILKDPSGNDIYCDDAGSGACWGNTFSLDGGDYGYANARSVFYADGLDASFSFDLSTYANRTLSMLMTSAGSSTGKYALIFQMATR